MALYSENLKSLDDLKDGATIAVPNDGSNESRALAFKCNFLSLFCSFKYAMFGNS